MCCKDFISDIGPLTSWKNSVTSSALSAIDSALFVIRFRLDKICMPFIKATIDKSKNRASIILRIIRSDCSVVFIITSIYPLSLLGNDLFYMGKQRFANILILHCKINDCLNVFDLIARVVEGPVGNFVSVYLVSIK